MLLIKKSVIAACLAGAKSAYPNEFIGLLEGEREKSKDGRLYSLAISRLIIPSGMFVSEGSASYSDWMTPMSQDYWGSFHSHPGTNSPRPSREDLHFFSKEGGIHLIASEPFDVQSIAAFDHRGRKLVFAIVP